MAERNTPDPGKPLTEDQFVKVQDADGNVQPNPVPKHWVGTDLLPGGTKEAPKSKQGDDSDSGSGSST